MGGWSIMNSAEGDLLFSCNRFSVQRRILACNIRALPGSFTFLFRRNFVIGNKGMDVLYSVRVAVSLAACIYFLNAKTKSLARAFIIGLGALATGWVCGSIFVPMIPSANTPKLDT